MIFQDRISFFADCFAQTNDISLDICFISIYKILNIFENFEYSHKLQVDLPILLSANSNHNLNGFDLQNDFAVSILRKIPVVPFTKPSSIEILAVIMYLPPHFRLTSFRRLL